MDLLEHQGKALLRAQGIAVPEGRVVHDLPSAISAAQRLGGACMVKAQVPQGRRGKAGLVQASDHPDTAARMAADLFGGPADIDCLLIERRLTIQAELYAAIRIDDVVGTPMLLVSTRGGIDIEAHSDSVLSLSIDMLDGLQTDAARAHWQTAGLHDAWLDAAAEFSLQLWAAWRASDAELMEVNPVIVDEAGRIWAADAKVQIDDNAMSRHRDLVRESTSLSTSATDPLATRARRLGINTWLELDGDIVLISTGASFGMMLLDRVVLHGARPANFIDMGGRAQGLSREKICELIIAHVRKHPHIRAIVVAFILSSQSLKMVVDAVTNAFAKAGLPCPVFAWLQGAHVATRDITLADARARLEALGMRSFDELDDTIAAAVAASKAGDTHR